jgi:hypothetical protein
VKQFTEFDGRLVGCQHVCRMGSQAVALADSLIFAVSGTKSVVAYDAFRRLDECPASPDLGGAPGALVWSDDLFLWTVTSAGVVHQLLPVDADTVALGLSMDTDAATNRWLLGVFPLAISAVQVNDNNRPHAEDGDEQLVASVDLDGLVAPGPLGSMILLGTNGSLLVELARISSVMSDISDAVKIDDTTIVAVSTGGEVAVVEVAVDASERITFRQAAKGRLDQMAGPRRLMLSSTGTLLVTIEQQNRVREYDISDLATTEIPVFIEERLYREKVDYRAVCTLNDSTDKTLFDTTGDDFIERTNYAVDYGIEEDLPTGAPSAGRVRCYLHARDGGVSISNPFVPAPMIGTLTTVGRSAGGVNTIGALDGGTGFPVNSPGTWRYYTTEQAQLQTQTYRIPGDPNVMYDIRVRVRGCTENSRFPCAVSTFTATGGQTVFTTHISSTGIPLTTAAVRVRTVTAAQVTAKGQKQAFYDAAYLAGAAYAVSSSGGKIRVTLVSGLAAGDQIRISIGSDITAPPYNQFAPRPGIRAADAPKNGNPVIDDAYLRVLVNAVETLRFRIGCRIDPTEITNGLNHTPQFHDAATVAEAAEFGTTYNAGGTSSPTFRKFCTPPYNTYHTRLDEFIDLRVPGQAVLECAQVTPDVFSSWPIAPDGVVDPPVGVQNNYNPPNTTGPYTFTGPYTPNTPQPESALVIPPDDDPEFPLAVPWAPRFPNAPFPWGQFLQMDVLRSVRAVGT